MSSTLPATIPTPRSSSLVPSLAPFAGLSDSSSCSFSPVPSCSDSSGTSVTIPDVPVAPPCPASSSAVTNPSCVTWTIDDMGTHTGGGEWWLLRQRDLAGRLLTSHTQSIRFSPFFETAGDCLMVLLASISGRQRKSTPDLVHLSSCQRLQKKHSHSIASGGSETTKGIDQQLSYWHLFVRLALTLVIFPYPCSPLGLPLLPPPRLRHVPERRRPSSLLPLPFQNLHLPQPLPAVRLIHHVFCGKNSQ